MRISDWSSDVCSSDLTLASVNSSAHHAVFQPRAQRWQAFIPPILKNERRTQSGDENVEESDRSDDRTPQSRPEDNEHPDRSASRSEENTSELPSLMRITYTVFSVQKKITHKHTPQS